MPAGPAPMITTWVCMDSPEERVGAGVPVCQWWARLSTMRVETALWGRRVRVVPGDHRLPRALHDGAAGARAVARGPDGGRHHRPRLRRSEGYHHHLRRRDPREPGGRPAAAAAGAGHRPHDLLAAGQRGWVTTSATQHTSTVLDRALQRADPPGVRPVPDQLRAGVPAAAVARRAYRRVGRASCAAAWSRWASSAATSTPIRSGGLWTGPPLGDRSGSRCTRRCASSTCRRMIHVSATCNDHFHTTGSHYLGADTTAFMQVLTSGCARDFPELRFIIPHGGGAVPYHWGRFKGMAQDMKRLTARRARAAQRLLRHLRVPPARHRPARSTWCRSTTSCSRRRWSARCGASTPRPATTTTTPAATSTPPTSPTDDRRKDLREQRPQGLPPAGRGRSAG